jgi:ATP-dependent DNA helicase DinG
LTEDGDAPGTVASRPRSRTQLDRLLAAKGPLAKALPGFQPRPQQLALAKGVDAALREGRPCLAEAGTGTGKTIGYLLPLLQYLKRTGGRAVISTHTLALQAQLIERDIPTLLAALPDWDIRPAVLKGRGNYLCLQDFAATAGDLTLLGNPQIELIRNWSNHTETGDLAELGFRFSGWSDIAANVDTCRQRECRYYDHCFLYKARRLADEANLVVVNHSLFFADLRLRGLAPGIGHLIPDYDAVVFDEAHHVEPVATKAFGLEWGSFRVPQLLNRLRHVAGLETDRFPAIQQLHETLMSPFLFSAKQEAFIDEALSGDADRAAFHEMQGELTLHLNGIARDLVKLAEGANSPAERDRANGLARMANRISTELVQVTKPDPSDSVSYFRWFHTRKTRADQPFSLLTKTPLTIDHLMRETLFSQTPRSIFVSATLANGDSFDYLKGRLGLGDVSVPAEDAPMPRPPVEVIQGSPFDFEKNCLLYVPRNIGMAIAPGYATRLADEILALIDAAGGRTFALFTSHRMLNEVRDRIWGRCGYPLFTQGEMAHGRLVEAFVEAQNGVLLGTSSFWEGVDVPGPALSCVVIDKLPFATPDSPIQRARESFIKEQGGDAFRELSLPQAQMRLKQGFGRLLRTSQDRGVVAILDSRLWTKGYGRQLLESLPACPKTDRIEDVQSFFNPE